jgi:UDP-3-O-[3-hydroxymyristoyl] glucosamine N-acyltransferase
MPKTTLAKIAEMIGATAPAATNNGAGAASADATEILGISSLPEAGPDQVSFCGDGKHLRQIAGTRAAAVIVPTKIRLPAGVTVPLLIVDDADVAVNKLLTFFAPPIPRPPVGVDPLARVDPTARLGDGCRIGPFVTVGARATVGDGCVLHPGVVVGDDTSLGDGCELHANVVVRERCTVGRRVIVNANSTIGTDGFGYRWDGRHHAKVPQIGTVVIGDDVELGSNTCVDRAKFSATVVGPGTKVDNLVQIGHNTRVGSHCIIVGQVGLAGSVTLGNGVVLGGQSAIRDHISLGDGSMVAACSGVAEDVDAGQVVSGLPALPHRQSLREQAALRRLPELVQQMRKLQEEVKRLRVKLGEPE